MRRSLPSIRLRRRTWRCPLPAISETALKLLRDKVGDEVEILDVSVPTIEYDPKTEERINQINEERANTTKATQGADQ